MMRISPIGLACFRDENVARCCALCTLSSCAEYYNGPKREIRRRVEHTCSSLLRGFHTRTASCGKPLPTRCLSIVEVPRGGPLARARATHTRVHTFEVLWVSFTTAGFEGGVAPPANLGDDADIIAAAYGGLAGAWYAHAGLSRDFYLRPGH